MRLPWVLKEDFETGGKAFAGLAISMFGEINSALAGLSSQTTDQHHQILERLDSLAHLAPGTPQAAQSLTSLAGQIESGFGEVLQQMGIVNLRITDLLKELEETKVIAEETKAIAGQTLAEVRELKKDITSRPTPVSVVIDQTRPKTRNWQGRKAEITEIQRRLGDAVINLIGITGLGGYGKSAVADKICEAANFPQKFWINVNQPYNFSELGRWLLGQLGYKLEEKAGDDLLATELVNRLAAGKYLLVLDNLETLLLTDGQWQYPAYEQFFLKWIEYGRNSVILITSREQPRLPPNNCYWHPLTGLLVPDGEQLLRDRGVQGSEAEIRKFVTLADGHPLLLSLAASLLEDRAGKNPNISALKDPDLNLFEIVGLHRGDPEASVGELFTASLERLDPKLQRLLLDLSVYRLPFNYEAATAQLPQESSDEITEQDLRQLARSSLLQELEQRDKAGKRLFQFQPLLLSFAREKAGSLIEAHQRAIGYYLATAKKPPWTTDADLAEYFEVFHHHCELKQYDLAYRILSTCYKFLDLHGYYLRLVSVYERLVQEWQPTSQQDQLDLGRAETNLGNAYIPLGQYKRAIYCLEQSLKIAQKIGNWREEATSLLSLGNAYISLGDYQRAIKFCQQCLEIANKNGDRQGEASSLTGLGNAYFSLGQYQDAIDNYRKSLNIVQEIGDRQGEANSLGSLGNVYNSLGRYPHALKFYHQCLEIVEEIKDRLGEATSLLNLGNAYRELGQYQCALKFYQKSLNIAREIEYRRGEADAWVNSGNVLVELKQKSKAITAYQNARELYQAMELDANVQNCDNVIQRLVGANLAVANRLADADPQPTPKKNWLQAAIDWFQD